MKTFWLGFRPDERRMHCEDKGGNSFFVLNGAWSGQLYDNGDGTFHIIDERGERHENVYKIEEQP